MNGRFEGNHALLPETLRLPNGARITIEFVVDTGFGGDLILPISVVAALGLPYSRTMEANLADDSVVNLALHSATVLWQDREREVDVLATGKRPLLGMELLGGSELVVQCRNGGLVTADEI